MSHAVPDHAAPETEQFLADLVDELTRRVQAGEVIDVEQVAGEHPGRADAIRRLLPTLELLGELGFAADGGAAAGGRAGAALGDLGDYRILRELGRGGMGIVYEAEQISLGRRVALKVLPFAGALDPRQLQRFRTEAQAAAQLHHTNIVPVYAVGCERGVNYYAMQFIEGKNLAAAIAEYRGLVGAAKPAPVSASGLGFRLGERQPSGASPGTGPPPGDQATVSYRPGSSGGPSPRPGAARSDVPVTPGRSAGPSGQGQPFFRAAAQLGIQAAEALDHAHGLGILHRDIKPANLMLDAFGKLWVTDFGLARLQCDPGMTLTGDLVGTLRYMSPEQALGTRSIVDGRTDLYSLGITLYELLTLRPAFAGGSHQEVLWRIAHEEPAPPRRIDPAIPRELETIVLKAIAKEPEGRYATAQELADDLRRYLEDRPLKARRPTVWEHVARWSRRHRTLVAAAVVVLLLAIVGLTVSTVLIGRERDHAQAQFELARRAVDEMYTQVAEQWLENEPRMTPLQRSFLEKAAGYYEDFARERGTDPAVRREAALAYRRIGDIRRKLGEYPRAEAAYRRAQEIQAGLAARHRDRPEYRLDLADASNNLGRLLISTGRDREAEEAFRKARDLYEGLANELPDRPEARLGLASASNNLGNTVLALGRYDEALRLHRQALDIREGLAARHPGRSDFRRDLARSYANLGSLLAGRGRLQEAEDYARRALKIRQELLGSSGDNPRIRQELADGYNNLGDLLSRTGRPAEAEDAFRSALKLEEGLAADNPTVPGPRHAVAGVHMNLGSLLTDRGRTAEAGQSFERARALLEALVREHPDVTGYRQDLAMNHYNQGLALLRGREAPRAEAELRRAIALYRELAAEFPDRPEYRLYLARGNHNLGVLLGELGRAEEAEQAYLQAREIKEVLAAAPHATPEARQELANTEFNLGHLRAANGRREEAERSWARALALSEGLVKEYPERAEYRASRDRIKAALEAGRGK